MIYNTKGIVLRTIKYGETSVVVNIFTERFGIRSYLVNGIRNTGKTSWRAGLFQPTSILELEVYHNELKSLQRIKEFKWSYLYRNILSDVTKNAVAVYMAEVLQKCLKQPETNPALFEFTEHAFMKLDVAGETVTANFPIYFSLQLVPFFGFGIQDNYSTENPILDLMEGIFSPVIPSHSYYLKEPESYHICQFLKTRDASDLSGIKLNKTCRADLLSALQIFYGLHFQEFGPMKTLPILQQILM